ncbi:hypothetical protein K438DRAFT_1766523 [Mycena galopus ATCC 62051]|nr:hypothetical protein K438DRAFT_1766523 [Mycena galopus ATCC 62051]
MKAREQRLLSYGTTLSVDMLPNGYHKLWATRLGRLADAVPDTHGLLIRKVWATLPDAIRSQISKNHCQWSDFCSAIVALEPGILHVPDLLPLPWFCRENAGNLVIDLPSNTRLVTKMTGYSPPSWRGSHPDRRPPNRIPVAPDNVWEDSIDILGSSALAFPSPKSMHHMVHGDVLGPFAPLSLAVAGSTRASPVLSRQPGDKMATNARLTSYNFTTTPRAQRSAPSVAGASAHLASLGIKRRQLKPSEYTKHDIDHSLYLYPVYLFPFLANGGSISECGLELKGILQDSRSLILDLGSGCVEVPLTGRAPPAYVPSNIYQLQLGRRHTHIELARSARVPGLDVLFDYWGWCKYVVHWLKDQDMHPRWDTRPLSYVISMPGQHPMRGVGRYTSDELSWMSGLPLHTLWGEVRKDPQKLCAVLESFFLFTFVRYCQTSEILSQCLALNTLCGTDAADVHSSFLLITTQTAVLRYNRMLSVHKQIQCSMSERKKKKVVEYNRLSLLSHEMDDDKHMQHAPWPFDLADLAGALLLPGHMGPAIVPNWDDLLASEAVSATTPEMRTRYESKLPSTLSLLQRLAFKPIVDMSSTESQMLASARGGSHKLNPVVEYFALPFFPVKLSTRRANTSILPGPLDASDGTFTDANLSDSDTDTQSDTDTDAQSETGMQEDPPFQDLDIDTNAGDEMEMDVDMDDIFEQDAERGPDLDDVLFGALSMLTDSEEEEDRNDIADTYTEDHYTEEPLSLVKDSATIKKLPTILYKSTVKPVFHTWTPLRLPKITTSLSMCYRPPLASVLLPCEDPLRKKKGLRMVKETTKLYTVGPMDFCGHAKAIRRGKGWVISLCRWDPSLNDRDQRFMMSTWEALGGTPKGFRKDKRSLIKKAVAFKAAAKKLLSRSWTLDRKITDGTYARQLLCL